MNELILSAANTPSKFNFKNAKLNEISAKIAVEAANMNSVYNAAKEGAEAVNKALAPLFGELMASKCYKDDGFKSVADYAEQTFGMSKSMAYMLARVGETFYNTGSEDAKKARETLSTSKLAELTSVDKKDIGKALKDGKLTADTSLAACREFATAHKKPGKEKLVPTFNVYNMVDKSIFIENVDKEVMFEQVAVSFVANGYVDSEAAVFFSTAKLDGDKPSAAQHFIAYTAGGFTRMYEYRPYTKPAAKTKGKGKDISSLKDMLAAMSPAERLELLKVLDGADDGSTDAYTAEEAHKEAGLF